MSIWTKLLGRVAGTLDPDEAKARQAFDDMRDAISRETPEQKQRFYLEVAAQLGNESAAKILAEMGPDLEKAKPN